ncbi:MAG: LPS export ABC transporter ATP-binding protein [Planctomycetes bacterium]|nr:LPS export ABC transporter ATP-binding protein [Planctomycetota bacterium]NQU50529.1 LPS export ABC transporter ATP-binding protein [Planctomycetota bacterium]
MLLSTDNLCKAYKGRKVVDQVSLTVAPGEIVGLLGPNGAGKTTTFRMCMGMVRPDSGKITIQNRDATKLPIYRRAHLGLGYLAQEPSVFRRLSVEDNLLAVLEITKHDKAEQKRRADALLEEFGLGHLRKSRGEVLSGGERRRLEIARTLATDPKLILLDEPFSGVDPVAVEEIQGILQQLQERGIAILLTDHNVRETLYITDRTYILAEGKILAEGTAEELAANETVRKVYLGQRFTLADGSSPST